MDPHPQANEPTLAIDGVHRGFRGTTVLREVNLEAAGGERVALTGPNGSGKTTLLRCIAGSLTVQDGRILVEGALAGSMSARQTTGSSLAQDRSFYQRLTGQANLDFYARLRLKSRREAAAQVKELTEELHLGDIIRRRMDRCSSGMVQQIAFARALLGAPRLLLLDEPTRSMDSDAIERFWDSLERRADLTVLIATHRPEDVERCGRVLEFPT
jgi:ABC-type multidrug transport system ATPase subunit